MVCMFEMIKKLITLLVLIGLVYMWYRIIDPMGAQNLVARVQSWFADDVVHTGTVVPPVIVQEPIVLETGTQDMTWVSSSWQHTGDVTVVQTIPSTTVSTLPSSHTGQASIPSKPSKPKPDSSSLSDQDMKDLQHLLNAIVE